MRGAVSSPQLRLARHPANPAPGVRARGPRAAIEAAQAKAEGGLLGKLAFGGTPLALNC